PIRVPRRSPGQAAKVTDLEQAPSGIGWSPDGTSIGYIARVPAKPSWSVKTPDKPLGAKWADPPIVVTRLRWRQDAAGITPHGYPHVFILSSPGRGPPPINSGDFDPCGRCCGCGRAVSRHAP